MTTVIIPPSVESIGSEVFSNNQEKSSELAIFGALESVAKNYVNDNGFTFVELADDNSEFTPEGFNIAQVKVYLDGREIVLDSNQWVKYENELLMPLQAISEIMDAKIALHADTAEIEIRKDKTAPIMRVDSNVAFLNNQQLDLFFEPMIINQEGYESFIVNCFSSADGWNVV